jgi:haloacid dehalogenase-like hydrolase
LKFTQTFSREEKTAFVTEQVKKGKTVALGDGINDAPALSEATVGVAMGAGTNAARESADVVLIGNDLMKFVETVRIARNCRRIIFQSFYGTLIVDTIGIGIGLAAVGLLNPLLAAFIQVASKLTFILNSTRLLAPKQKETVFETEAAPPGGIDRPRTMLRIAECNQRSRRQADFAGWDICAAADRIDPSPSETVNSSVEPIREKPRNSSSFRSHMAVICGRNDPSRTQR